MPRRRTRCKGEVASLFLGPAAVLGLCFVLGCEESAEHTQTQTLLAETAAADISRLAPDRGPAILVKEAGRVRAYVREALARNEIGATAALINTEGPWHDASWYPLVASEFARAFCGPRPILLRDADCSLRALERLASSGYARGIRIHAATAIRFDRPAVAKQALLAEYARVGRGHFSDTGTQACGPLLRELGIVVPDEITDMRMMNDYASSVPIDASDSAPKAEVLAEAAERYNALLRGLLDAGDMKRLASLAQNPEQVTEVLGDLIRDVASEDVPQRQPEPLFR
jgi:hypothetical protein